MQPRGFLRCAVIGRCRSGSRSGRLLEDVVVTKLGTSRYLRQTPCSRLRDADMRCRHGEVEDLMVTLFEEAFSGT